jgi:hypothetical protein
MLTCHRTGGAATLRRPFHHLHLRAHDAAAPLRMPSAPEAISVLVRMTQKRVSAPEPHSSRALASSSTSRLFSAACAREKRVPRQQQSRGERIIAIAP